MYRETVCCTLGYGCVDTLRQVEHDHGERQRGENTGKHVQTESDLYHYASDQRTRTPSVIR